MKQPLRLALLTLALGSLALPAFAQTQMELNERAHDTAMASDAQLNQSYKRLMGKLDARKRSLLVKAELKWITFRDAECAFEQDKYRGGSMQPLMYWNTYNRLTETRLGQLEAKDVSRGDMAADVTLNKLYQSLVKRNDAEGQKLLQTAELAWIAFRDAEADFSSTRFATTRADALARLTTTRNRELETEIKDSDDH